jgi:hypothetical protein
MSWRSTPLAVQWGAAKEVTEDFNKIFINIDAMMQEHLPGVSLVVVGHTRKADLIFKGPQVLAGNIDNMIYVERIGKELKANAYSEFSRNASEFHEFGFTLIPQAVATDEGMQNFLAVNGLTAASDNKAAGTTDKEKDDELAFKTLLSFYQGDHTWTQHTAWFRVTKAARGDKLGNSTFSDIIKSLLAKGRIRVNAEGLYQVVFGPAEPPSSSAGDAYSSSSYSPPKEAGVGGVTVDCSRNTPGVGSSNKVGVGGYTPKQKRRKCGCNRTGKGWGKVGRRGAEAPGREDGLGGGRIGGVLDDLGLASALFEQIIKRDRSRGGYRQLWPFEGHS